MLEIPEAALEGRLTNILASTMAVMVVREMVAVVVVVAREEVGPPAPAVQALAWAVAVVDQVPQETLETREIPVTLDPLHPDQLRLVVCQ